MATRVRSYSKINLGLRIGAVRPDGFHGLATLYQTLALHDWVTVEARKPTSQNRDVGHPTLGPFGSTISLTTNHPHVPVDARNTAWKMVERALERMGVAAEVKIHIEKALPVQGGMGAGSANAAAALIGLERELGVALSAGERLAVAAEVGSDVPLFLVGGAVLGEERGEVVRGMRDFGATPCVVAVPEVGVSTPRAFRDWDEKAGSREEGVGSSRQGVLDSGPAGRLTPAVETDRLKELSRVYASVLGSSDSATDAAPDTSGIAGDLQSAWQAGSSKERLRSDLAEDPNEALLALVRTGIENDFEEVVFPQYPPLCDIKRELMGVDSGSPAMYAALSGSGSALFGLYRTAADAMAAQRRVQAFGCRALVTETLPRREYWQRMFAE